MPFQRDGYFYTEIYSPQHGSKHNHHLEKEGNVPRRAGEECTWLHSICEQHPENKTRFAPPGTSSASGVRASGCSRNALSKGITGHTSSPVPNPGGFACRHHWCRQRLKTYIGRDTKRKVGEKDEKGEGEAGREKWICRGRKKGIGHLETWPCLREASGAPAIQAEGFSPHPA